MNTTPDEPQGLYEPEVYDPRDTDVVIDIGWEYVNGIPTRLGIKGMERG